MLIITKFSFKYYIRIALTVALLSTYVLPASANNQCQNLFQSLNFHSLKRLIENQPFPVPPKIARGFSKPDYGAREFIEMIFGNRQNEFQSWALQKSIDKKIKNGVRPDTAFLKAHAELLDGVTNQLNKDGFGNFYEQQMKASYIGLDAEKKTSSVLFAGPISKDNTTLVLQFGNELRT